MKNRFATTSLGVLVEMLFAGALVGIGWIISLLGEVYLR